MEVDDGIEANEWEDIGRDTDDGSSLDFCPPQQQQSTATEATTTPTTTTNNASRRRGSSLFCAALYNVSFCRFFFSYIRVFDSLVSRFFFLTLVHSPMFRNSFFFFCSAVVCFVCLSLKLTGMNLRKRVNCNVLRLWHYFLLILKVKNFIVHLQEESN